MTKDEFMSLPPTIALGLIYDVSAAVQKAIGVAEKPRSPLPPKYDRRVYRKGGFNYASEMTLESLTYWLGKKREGAAAGGQYAEKDAKDADELQRWVTWRTWYPSAVWSGVRGDGEMTARPPSKSPTLHSNETSPRQPPRGDAYEGDAGEEADSTF